MDRIEFENMIFCRPEQITAHNGRLLCHSDNSVLQALVRLYNKLYANGNRRTLQAEIRREKEDMQALSKHAADEARRLGPLAPGLRLYVNKNTRLCKKIETIAFKRYKRVESHVHVGRCETCTHAWEPLQRLAPTDCLFCELEDCYVSKNALCSKFKKGQENEKK